MDYAYPTSSAQCAQHPERQALAVCQRCGSFMCSDCRQAGPGDLCPACVSRTEGTVAGFPFSRHAWDFGSVMNYAWEAFQRQWLPLSLAGFIFMVVTYSVSFAMQLVQNVAAPGEEVFANFDETKIATLAVFFAFSVAGGMVQGVIQGILQMGLVRMCATALTGGTVSVGQLFGQLEKFGKLVIQMFLVFALFALPTLLYAAAVAGVIYGLGGFDRPEVALAIGGAATLLVMGPLLYFSIPLSFMNIELAMNDSATPMQCLRNCFAIAKDHRLWIVVFGLVVGLVVMVGMAACCVGIFPALALGNMMLVGLYLTLRNGSGLSTLN